MRNLVSFAVASLLLLPAFGARAVGSASGDEAGPGSSGGEESPDRPVRAKPTVVIDTTHQSNKLDSAFTINLQFDQDVSGLTVGEIGVEGATIISVLTETDAQNYSFDIETDKPYEGNVTVTIPEDAAENDEGEGNERAELTFQVDVKAPVLERSTADSVTIVLYYDEELDEQYHPQTSQYTVTIGRVEDQTRDQPAVTGVDVEDDSVTLMLADADWIMPGDTVFLAYSATGTALRDEKGNVAAEIPPAGNYEVENLRKITKPGPVEDLTAEVTETTIKLDWDQPTDTGGVRITGYRVQGAKDGGGFDDLQSGEDEGHDSTEFTHENLTKGESWEYLVQALNRAGASTAERITAVTRNPKPGPPRDLEASADGTTAIDLEWKVPTDTGTSGVTGYRIEESTNAGTSWSDLVTDTKSTGTTYERTGLSAGTTRHYRVSAINKSGTGEASDTAAATTRAGEPGPPENLSATADGQNAIDLDWDAPSDHGSSRVVRYKIEESANGTSWDSIAGTDSTTTAYERTGLSAGQTRHYRVFAVNTTGPSVASDTASATTESPGEAPDPPRNLKATADGQTAINLDWDAPSDHGSSRVVRYKIEESPNGSTSWDSIAGTDSTKTDYRRTGLSAGTTRHYRVFAVNDDSTSDPSNVASATTRAVGRAPSAPRNLTARADGENTIDLRWELPADTGSSAITAYRIEESENDTTWTVLVDSTETTGRSYERENLSPGDTRYYRVSAHNKDSTSVPSNVASATTESARPGAPTNLQATAQDSSTIDLTWVEPEDDGGSPINGYRIEWSPDGSGGWEDVVANTGSDATSYSDEGLDPNTTRHYRVSARNTKGDGPPSNVDDATTLAGRPGRPQNLRASARDTSQIDLTWRTPDDDGGAEITGYRIEWSDDRSGWVDLVVDTESDDTDHIHTNLRPGTTRYYRVSAINSAGTGRPSLVATATTLDVPGAPRGLSATPNGKTQIDLRWSAPSDDGGSPVEGYQVDASDNGGATWTVLVEDSRGTATTYSHTGLSAGETWHYRVRAINEWGKGAYTDPPASATTDASEPGPPQDLVAEANGQTQIALDWDPPDDDGGSRVTGYRIEFSGNGGATWSTLESNTRRTTTLYHDQNLDPGTTRHYRVAAINSVGTGDYSNEDSATTAPAVPGPPTGLSAIANGTAQIDLAWSAPADDGGARVTGYRIEVSDNGTSWRDLRSDTNSDDTDYPHTGLDPGTTRHYRVSAINAAGTGDPSDVAFATTDPTVPDPPTGLAAAADGQTRIRLSWVPPAYDGGAAVTAYRVEVSSDSAATWAVLEANTGSARAGFTHTDLDPGTTRHYRVSAINVAGWGNPSDVAHATTDATVPAAPTDLEATASGISQIDLVWTAPTDNGGAAITAYRVEVSTTRGATWRTLVDNTGNTATSYSHTGLDPATRRDYRVSAINRVGAGEASNVAHATTDPDFPDPPTNLAATADGPRAIDLSWNEPVYTGGVPVTGYRVEVSEDGGATWAALADTDADDYSHTGLDPASTRHYRVFAVNEAGLVSEDPSNEASATTDPIAPDAPTDLTATANGTSRIDLVWNAPGYDGGAEIMGYRIEVSVDGGIVWRDLVENTGSRRTAYAHTGLNPATTRYYRVSAINRAGVSDPSNEADATTDATVPDAPMRLRAEAEGSEQIDLSWTAPGFDGGAEITGYRIEVSEDAGSNWANLVANTGTRDTDYSHTGLRPASTRHYRVSAINEIGTGAPSEVAEATTDAVAPDPPTGLVAIAVSPTQIDLGWTAPDYDGGSPVTSYRIEVSEDGATWTDLAPSTGSTQTRFSHLGLEPGSTRHYRVSAINVAGVGEPSAVASASTDDPVERAGRVNQTILPHFAGAAITSTLGAISARIEAVAARNPLPSQLRAAGLASLVGRLRGDGSAARLLNGTSFHMPVGGLQQQDSEGFGAAAWGSAEYFGMGQPDGEEIEWEGGMMSLHLGADMRLHRDFLAGVSASRSSGDFDFTDVTGAREVAGTYEPQLTSVNPYFAWLPGRTGVSLWAAGSFGWGEVAVDDEVAGLRSSDMRSTTGALGGSRILVANGPSALRMRAEAWLSRLDVDDDPRMDSLTLEMQRARFALEWSQVHKFRSGDEVTVMLEGGARFGDGEGTEGAGMEFGGGMRYSSPSSGLTMEGHGRLLASGDNGYEEWGARGLIQVDPQSATGLSVRLVPAWGETASGVQELWDRGVSGRPDRAAGMRKGRLNAEIEYGLANFHGTPYGRAYVVDGGTRAFGTGMKYEVGRMLDLRIEGTRTQGSGTPARHGLALRGHWRF